MNGTLEARKLSILEYLAEVEDEAIIVQIENILKPKIDIWDELSKKQKAVIQKGIKELDEGKRIPLREQVINNLPVMAKLFFLVKVLKKLSIVGLRFTFLSVRLWRRKRASQNG